MLRKNLIVVLGVLTIGVSAISVTAEAKSCHQAGGSATMVTMALAQFMAKAALKNSIASHGWTAAGPIRMKCKDEGLTESCTARQRACK